jgi:hypothetical protein
MKMGAMGPVAGAFYRSNGEFDLICGPVGSGKTTAAALRVMRHAYEQTPDADGIARTRCAVVRNTRRQLQDTTIKTWREIFPDDEYGAFQVTAMVHHWKFKPRGLAHFIDCEVVFRALDDASDVRNLLSAEYSFCWFNETREIDQEIITHMARRVGRFPANSCTYFGMFGDTNSFDTLHYLYDRFVLQDIKGWTMFKQPGGLDKGAENIENLPGGREYYERAVRDYAPHDADVFVHNLHVSSRAGKPVFASYNDGVHAKTFEIDQRAALSIGYDNSGVNPAAAIGYRTSSGQWRIVAESIGEDVSVEVHAQNLKRFLAMQFPLNPIARVTCDPSSGARGPQDISAERVLRQVFAGIPVLKARTNDPQTRIQAVDGRFRTMINGGPAILIHTDCKVLRKACISEYAYRRLKLTGRGDQYADEPNKNHPFSDVADSLEYLLLGGGEIGSTTGTLLKDSFVLGCEKRNRQIRKGF